MALRKRRVWAQIGFRLATADKVGDDLLEVERIDYINVMMRARLMHPSNPFVRWEIGYGISLVMNR